VLKNEIYWAHGMALKEQKPKNHKNIEQKPKIKSRNIKRSSQARRNTKHRQKREKGSQGKKIVRVKFKILY